MTYYDELTERDLLLSAWQTLRRIESALGARLDIPAPQVHVAAPDLTDIVNAVTGLNGTGPTAAEIASAIAAVIAPDPAVSPDGAGALHEVAEALKKLDYRLKGMGTQAYGGGSVSLMPGQTVGVTGPVSLDDPTLAALETIIADPSPLTSLAQTQVAVTTTQVAVPATNLAGRTAISIEALAANGSEVYIGLSGVTTTTGRELAAGAAIDIDLADTVQLYAVSASGTQRISVTEVA